MIEILRDRAWEQGCAREYAHGANVSSLIAFAQARADAHGDCLRIAPRDFRRELIEEIADACNYLVWWLWGIHLGYLKGDVEQIGHALHGLIVLWNLVVG